jgi:hypothetical protein
MPERRPSKGHRTSGEFGQIKRWDRSARISGDYECAPRTNRGKAFFERIFTNSVIDDLGAFSLTEFHDTLFKTCVFNGKISTSMDNGKISGHNPTNSHTY